MGYDFKRQRIAKKIRGRKSEWSVNGRTADYRSDNTTLKVATLTYRALHGSAPPYSASSFTLCRRHFDIESLYFHVPLTTVRHLLSVADMPHRRRLRSASTEQLDVPTCRRSTIGGRAFPVAGAKVWNGLPSDVTSSSSLSRFKNRLKTYLFRRCYETA